MALTRARTKRPPEKSQKTIILRIPEPLFFRFRRKVLERQENGSTDSGNDVLVGLVESWLKQAAA